MYGRKNIKRIAGFKNEFLKEMVTLKESLNELREDVSKEINELKKSQDDMKKDIKIINGKIEELQKDSKETHKHIEQLNENRKLDIKELIRIEGAIEEGVEAELSKRDEEIQYIYELSKINHKNYYKLDKRISKLEEKMKCKTN